MGIKQRVSLRKFIDDIRRWVDEDRSDEWIAGRNAQKLTHPSTKTDPPRLEVR